MVNSVVPSHTTHEPTLDPSGIPSQYPTQHPSTIIIKPTTRPPTPYPSTSPIIASSELPTQVTTLQASDQPSSQPVNFVKTSTLVPTSASDSHSPSHAFVKIEISPFLLKLVSTDDIPNILDKDVAYIAGIFLTDYLRSKLSTELGFQYAVINIGIKTNGRRLDVAKYFTCSGDAFFNSNMPPTTSALDKVVLSAFSDTKSNNEFLTLLMNSSNSFSQVIEVEARGVSEDKVAMSPLIKTIMTVTGIVCASLVVLFIQIQRKRRQKAQDLRYTAQSDEDSTVDYLEPLPIRISNDHKAVQRSVLRARFEREIIKEANAKLQADKNVITPKSHSIKFGPATDIIDAYNMDEERGSLSIMFTESHDTSLSSLWGEKASFEDNSSMDTESQRGDNIEKGNQTHQVPKINLYECGDASSMTSPLGADIVSPQNSESNMMYSPATQNSDCEKNIPNENLCKKSIFDRMSKGFRKDTDESGSDESSEQTYSDSNQFSDSDSSSLENELAKRNHDRNLFAENKGKPDNSNYFTSVFTRRY
jgi:hypothetical protein